MNTAFKADCLYNNAVAEAKAIHNFLHMSLDLGPVFSSLNKFVDLFLTENPIELTQVADKLSNSLGIVA